jgi:uncharacterized delta-60 repeat protein
MTPPTSRRRTIAWAVSLGLVSAAVSVASVEAASAAGLDPAFGTAGLTRLDLSVGGSDRLHANAPGPGGTVYHAGYTTVSETNRAFVVAKTTPSGALDVSFGSGGVAVVDVTPAPFTSPATGAGETARGVAVRPDGKVLVLGQAEAPQDAADPADIDVYVVQLNADGTRDNSFGTSGVRRVDLSPGRLTAPEPDTISRDQAGYNISLRPDGKAVFTASQGLDDATPARTDRELVAVQLTTDGALDTTFGGDGIANTVNPGVTENPRRGFVDGQGRYVTSGYGTPTGGKAQPWIYRFNPDGTLDTSFDTDGIATGQPAGPNPGFAEAYAVVPQGNKYVVAAYGTKTADVGANGADAIFFRFTQAGALDPTFGTNGITAINRTDPGKQPGGTDFNDRARSLAVLPDNRIIGGGVSGPDALAVVLTPEGQPDTTVSPTGTFLFDFGGDADSIWGISVVDGGNAVVMSGYGSVAANPALDASAVLKLSVVPAANPGPPGDQAFTVTSSGSITGKLKVGKKLTAIDPVVSPAASTTSYQWLRNGVEIPRKAQGAVYKLTRKDRRKAISVRITKAQPGYETLVVTVSRAGLVK